MQLQAPSRSAASTIHPRGGLPATAGSELFTGSQAGTERVADTRLLREAQGPWSCLEGLFPPALRGAQAVSWLQTLSKGSGGFCEAGGWLPSKPRAVVGVEEGSCDLHFP